MINAKKEAINCDKNNGPYFGGRDFSIESNMKTGQTYANSGTNFISNNNLELIGEKGNNKNFDVEDFKIFKVIY